MKTSFTGLLLVAGILLAASVGASAATINVNSSTSWSALTGGSGPGGLPGATDSVVVLGGANLTVDVANGQCGSLQLGGTTLLSGNGTLTFQSGSQLTCATNVTLGNSTRTGSLDFAAGGLLQVGGAITVTALGTFTAGAGTIEYNGAGAQTVVSTLGSYNHLKISGANTKTLGGAITVNGDLTIGSGVTLAVSGSNYAIALGGNWVNNGGTFSAGSGIVRLTGAGAQSIGGSTSTTFSRLTINKAGGTATADVDFGVSTVFTNLAGTFDVTSRTITLSGSGTPLVLSGGTFTTSTSTISYTSTSGATVAGGLTYYNLSTAGNSAGDTFTAGADFTVANVMTVGQGIFNGSSRTITLSGSGTPLVFSGGTFTPSTSAIAYTGGSGATVAATSYNNLTINGTGTFALAGATTVSTTLSLTSGDLSIGANALTLNGAISTGGGTLTGGSSSDIVFGGSGASTTLPAVILHDLTVNRANGIALGGAVNVGGTLTLTSGAVTSAANLTLGNGVTISRQTGSLSAAPVFGTSVNVTYTGSSSVATGSEIPTSTTVLNNFSNNNTATVTLGSALFVNGNLAIANSAVLDVSTSNYGVSVGGDWINTGSGALTARSGTVTFNGTADQAITGTASTTFNNLTVNKSGGTLNVATSTTISGTLTLTAGTLTVGGVTLTLNGPTIAGTPENLITSSASTLVFGGSASGVNIPSSVTALNGLTINNANGVALNSSPTLSGTLTLTSGALSLGANTLTLNGPLTRTSGSLAGGSAANLVFGGTGAATSLPAVSLNDLTVNRPNGISLSADVTVNGTLTLGGGALSIGAHVLTLSGLVATSGGTLTGGSTSDLIVDGSGANTTLPAVASGLRNLTLNRANGLTLGGAVTVSTTLSLTDGQLNNGANLALGNNATIYRATGSLAAAPTYGTTVNVSYTGSSGVTTGPEIPASATVLNNLTNNNSGDITLGGNATVNTRLALNSGILATGPNQINLAAAAVVTGAGSGSYVNGNLQKAFNTGANQSFTFPIGSTVYTPVSVGAMTVTTAGTLLAKVTAGDHPGIATNGLDSAKSVNRYWTLNAGGIVASTYNLTNIFDGSDVDAGANPLAFVVRRYNGSAWLPTTVGARTATTVSAVGLNAFSDFAVGEQLIHHYAVSAASPQTAGVTFNTTVTAQDILNETVTADSSTVLTMTATGSAQFDSDGNSVFGDNTKALTAGTFTINTKDDVNETINLTATDANLKTGTLSNLVINLPAGAYRSAANGNWNNAGTWETNNGASWFPAATTPASGNAGLISIQSGHTVTVTADVIVDELTVNGGGQLNVNDGVTVTVTNGTGVDLDVLGTVNNAGTITNLAGAVIAFESLGKYQHNFSTTPGTIPTATWAADAACEIVGYTSNVNPPAGLGQTFGHFTWNCPSQAAGVFNLNGGLTDIVGNFTIVSTGAGDLAASTNGGSAGSLTMNIGRDLVIQGGSLIFDNNAANPAGTPTYVLNLGGNYHQTGGSFDHTATEAVLTVNFTGANSTFTRSSGTLTTTRMNFNVNAGALLTLNSGLTVESGRTFTVLSGGTLNCGTSIVSGAGTFAVNSGGSLGIGAAAGLVSAPTADGNIQTTIRTFNSGGNYSFNGTAAQATGSGLPATVNNLTITNSAGVTLSQNTTVNGSLNLASGVVDATGSTLILANSGSISGGGSASYVNGFLRKSFGTGSGQSFTFAIGDGANYAPIDLASVNVTSAGSLTARAIAGDHPQLGTSSINPAASVNRYWTLTNSPAGIAIATNTVTFNFVGVGTDVDVGATPSSFVVQRYNGGWSTSSVGNRTAVSTTALGVTAFGDFAVGNSSSGGPTTFTTNTLFFNYTNRAALLAAGWDFLARTTNGTTRNTETTAGTSPPDVAYARTNAGLGTVLRVPVDTGDLWAAANNTRNSLFRDLSPDWQSVRLQVSFAPTQPFQQLQLALYQDDNNYVEVGSVYTYPANPAITFSLETNGVPRDLGFVALSTTNLHLRLDRDLTYGLITGFYSLDGTNWVTMGQTDQDLVGSRLAVWVGGSPGGFPNADLYKLQIITSDTPVVTTLDFQRPTYVFNAVAGQACTNLQRARVIHRGPAGLHWNLTNTASWLSTSVTSGNAATAFDLSVDTTGLAAGIYETGVKFGAPDAANTPATLNVKLIVNPDVRAKAATWRGGKRSAMSVWVDDSSGVMFNILQTNGYAGTYLLWGVDATHLMPSFFTNYYNAGMELGAHTVHHVCNELQDEHTLRSEIESNVADILTFTPAQQSEVITFAFPCGLAGVRQKASAADYFLVTRGYNINQLEDASPYDWMFLKCHNSHENDPAPYNPSAPPNPSDFKTVVDAAIAQGKWANLVFHGLNNDDGAVAYSVGKDIWVAPGGTISKYVHQRDRTVISNYVETVGQIRFDSYRLPLESSIYRNFESALKTNDLVTFQVDVTGVSAVTNVTVDGISTTNYSMRSVAGKMMLFVDTLVTGSAKRIALGISNATNHPPVLATNNNVAIGEGQTLTITNSATDPDTNALTFTLGPNAPSGMTISTNGILSWVPGETTGGSNFPVTVIVTDNGLPALSASNTFTVTVNEMNVAPVLPSQSDRLLIGQTLLTVVNTATDADIPANPLGYSLLVGPTNAAISSSGVITWTPSASQVPSTNTFTTVVTDTNTTAVNGQNLNATNSFVVTVTATPLTLPGQTNRTINEFATLTVTNTASDPEIASPGNVGYLATNTYNFTYTNRAALLADGWDFIARTTNGSPRDTEQTSGAVVSYDQAAHPGALRVPVDVGDLWQFLNSTRNSLFRDLSTNWLSMRLNVSLTPTQNYQQVHLTLYQDDDNWVHTGLAYNSGYGGVIVPIVKETAGVPDPTDLFIGTVTNIHVRLDRNAANGNITALYSLDGTNWTTIGSRSQSLVNPRLALWTGGSPSGFPNADYRRVDVVVTNAPKRLTYFLLNAPAGAQINTNGVITWTPGETQGPSTNVITTVVTDNGSPALFATNSFTVIVNELNASPSLTLPANSNIAPQSAWSALATATDSDVPTNTWGFSLVSGPVGLTVSPAGLISWTPDQSQAMTTNTVSVRVTDTNPPAVDFTSLSVTGTFQIVVSPLLTVTAANSNRFYGDPNPTFTGMLTGVRPGDNITATYVSAATTNSPVGTYPIVPVLNDPAGVLTNYIVVTNTGVLTVTVRPLTVIADAKNKVFGAADPALTYQTTSGSLVNGDALVGALTRLPGENAGLYAILQGTLAASTNYALSYVGANLTISQSNAVVTLGNLNQSYNGTARNASATTTPAGLTVALTYNGNAAVPTNAGSYEVIGTINELNYAGAATNTLVIAPSNAVVTLGDLSQTYDGNAKTASATTDPSGLTVALTYNGNAAAPTNAGSYEVIGTINELNYAGSATNTLVIAPSNAVVTLGDLSQTYDGNAKSASATTDPSGLTVALTYNGNAAAPTNAGSYEVIGTINELNYAGSATNTLVIAPSNAVVTLGDLSQTYDGNAKSASATTDPSGLTVALTYNGSVDAPTNAGSYEVIGTINELNYAGAATNTLVIAPSNAVVTLGDLSQTYDGNAKSASVTTDPSGLTVALTYNGNADAPTNAGSYEVIGTINELNYAGSATNTLVIAASNAVVTLGNLSQTYDGNAKSASATTDPSGLTVALTYNGSVDAPTNAGSYEVIGTINELNYAGAATNTLVIAPSNAVVTLGDLSQTYDGNAKSASATTDPSGLTVALTYNGSAEAPTNAGSYEVIGTINELNYAGVATNTLVIAPSNAVVTLGDLSQTYDGNAKSASVTTDPSGLTVALTYNGSAEAPTNAGSYEVIGTINELNYAGSATNTLVIAPSNAVVTLGDLSQTYDGNAKSASVTTDPSSLTVALTYNGSAEAPTNAGSYEVIGTINELNYAGAATNTLVIAASNAVVTLGDLSQTYDGTARNASATTDPSGLTVALTYNGNAAAPTNAGSYEVIGTINELNYAGSATNTLVIAPSNAVVTLGDLSQTYDGNAKSASVTTDPSSLTVALTYNGSAEAPTNAGSYEVIGTINELNYAGSATNTLVIAPSNAVVTLGDLSQTYDGNAKTASATTDPSGLTVALTYNGNAEAPTNAGSYEVIGTINELNYAGSATNTLVIAPSNAVVTLGDLSQTYDGNAKTASATTDPSGLTVALTYNGSAEAPTNAGSYEVIGTINELNYAGSATNTLVIAPSNAVVTLGDLSQTYDGNAKTASVTTEPAGLAVNVTYDGSPNAPTNAGSYEVIGTINELNYTGSATNTLVILPAAQSFPITSIGVDNDIATITWDAVDGRTYRVQYKDNLTDPDWNDLVPDITATGASASTTNSVVGTTQRFYRAILLP